MSNNSMIKPNLYSIAFVEMYVSNLFYAKNFFINALQFEHVSTREKDGVVTYLMQQGNISYLLSSSLTKNTPVARHVNDFGDAVKRIGFWVNDANACFDSALNQGATVVSNPENIDGVMTASVDVYNEVEHVFLEDNGSNKVPGFEYSLDALNKTPMIYNIDHIASCHPPKMIGTLVEFYKNAFSFSENKNEDIYSEESGMHIIIMKSPNGKINLPLVEPSSDTSPLHTYLRFNHGSGIHHIAFETDDIVKSVQHYEARQGELRKARTPYYDEMKEKYPEQIKNIEKIAPHGIMLEEDEKGILFQIFTKPVVTRPTFFLEFVQREKCEGFGTVNIKALYDTLEV